MACSTWASGGSDGAMRMLRSRGSFPYGNVAPAPGQLDARLVGQTHDVRRATVERVEADEVPPARRRPRRDALAAELRLENPRDGLELRPQQRRVLRHVRANAGEVLEEARVAQLVDLVGADRLNARRAAWRLRCWRRSPPSPQCRRPQTRSSTSTRTRAAGSDVRRPLHAARMFGEPIALRRTDRGRRTRCPRSDRKSGAAVFMRASRMTTASLYVRTGRIAVLRHAPHALDRGVARDEALDLVHVRPFVGHVDRRPSRCRGARRSRSGGRSRASGR